MFSTITSMAFYSRLLTFLFFFKTLNSSLRLPYKNAVFATLFVIFSFSSSAQILSIGSPVNGTEGLTFVSFSVDMGVPNSTGSPITGSIVYSGTSTNGADFTAPTTFSIPNGVSSTLIVVSVIDDALLEGSESITATIFNPSAGTISNPSETATIFDNEASSVTVSIGSPVDGTEGGSDASFDVQLDLGVINNTSAPITGSIYYSGTANDNFDFVGPDMYSIPVGANSTTIVLPLVDDGSVECNETITADISNPINSAINTNVFSSTTNIIDDECSQLAISINSTTSSVVEGANNIFYVVSLDGGVINETGAAITGALTLSGTANSGTDYINVTSFSIQDGASDVQIIVPLIDDNIAETTESLIATISAPSLGSVSAVGSSSTVTILDDDAGSIFIEINTPLNGIEGSSDISFNIEIVSGGPSAVPINGTISYGGTATDGSDYSGVYTYIIPAGMISTTVILPVIDDLLIEGDETVDISLTGSPSIGMYANNFLTTTIIDDDAGIISIGSPVDGVEGTSSIGFTIFIDGGIVNNSGSPITGNVAYTGTASQITDYMPSPSTFSIPDGASSTTIAIPVINDLVPEPTKNVMATISNPSSGFIGVATSTANIIDDDLSSLTLSIGSPVDAIEGGVANFTIQLDGGVVNFTGSPITGTINYSAGTASSSTDFVGSTLFTIQPGNNSTTINLAIIQDNLVECDETIIATISNPTVGTVSPGGSTSTAIITDADCSALTMSISSPVSAVAEGVGSMIPLELTLDNNVVNATGAPITGVLTLTGTATSTTDYVNVTSFSIPNGSNSVQLDIIIIDDAIVEPTETLIATISSPNVGSISATGSSVSVDILDDDAGSVLISIGSPVDATEGTSDISYTIFIEGGGLNSTGAPITGNITYAGSALSGVSYTTVPVFSIPVGLNSTIITIPVLDDAIVEPTETVIAILTGSPSVGSYANTSSTATIFDDDASSLMISIGSPTDGTEGSTFVSYIVSLDAGATNGTGSDIIGSVTYVGTANDVLDYTGPATFTIPPGSNSTFVILPVIDDLLIECDETVIATILNPSIGTINVASSTALIIDDECAQGAGSISISNPIDGTEGGADVSYTVSLDNGLINGTGAPINGMVSFAGTATAGLDFSNTSTFSIPDGASFVTLDVSVIDDINIECDETVIATISNPSVGTIGNATETAIIIDNECSQFLISIGSPVDGSEPGTPLSFNVFIEGGLINSTGVPITGSLSLMGTATDGVDFTSGTSSFSIADGTSSILLSMSVIDDLLIEGTETVIVTIANPSIGAIGNDTETANILDNDSTNGFDDLFLNNLSVTIYPNPVNSMLNLDAEKQMKNYSIADLNGRLMSSGILTSKEATLNVDSLPKGAYFVTVTFEDGSMAIKKVLKQ